MLMNFWNMNVLLVKNLFDKNRFLFWVMCGAALFQVVSNLFLLDTSLPISPLGAITVISIIFILYGITILTKSKMIKTFYELHREDGRDLTDDESLVLKTAFWTKNAFWNTFSIMALVYVVNIYVPAVPLWFSFWVKDILFVFVLFYGIQAERFMDEFFSSMKKNFENNL